MLPEIQSPSYSGALDLKSCTFQITRSYPGGGMWDMDGIDLATRYRDCGGSVATGASIIVRYLLGIPGVICCRLPDKWMYERLHAIVINPFLLRNLTISMAAHTALYVPN